VNIIGDKEDEFLIVGSNSKILLQQNDVVCNPERHIVNWGKPAEILDWDSNVDFYIVYERKS